MLWNNEKFRDTTIELLKRFKREIEENQQESRISVHFDSRGLFRQSINIYIYEHTMTVDVHTMFDSAELFNKEIMEFLELLNANVSATVRVATETSTGKNIVVTKTLTMDPENPDINRIENAIVFCGRFSQLCAVGVPLIISGEDVMESFNRTLVVGREIAHQREIRKAAS